MNKTLLYIMAAALCGTAAIAQAAPALEAQPAAATAGQETCVGDVALSGIEMRRNGDYLSVKMLLDMKGMKVESNQAVLLTPVLVNGTDSLPLPAVGVYGRRRYYHYLRNSEGMLSGKDELSIRASEIPDNVSYSELIPYQEWMNGATLELNRRDYGCCNTLLAEQGAAIGSHKETDALAFFPPLVYVQPKAEAVKSRSLEGSAFIDFPVDKTTIYPDYRRNTTELSRIQATIDSVRNDRDVTITQVWLKGFASPESPYSHNRDLAIGRTEALKNYITQLYHFNNGVIATDYEPEDWAGLRRYVELSNLSHRDEILAIIDGALEPDSKEAKIKKSYPEEYRFLLQNCYPALRHTDYRITYDIRGYSDTDEIERIMRTRPQNLSLNEFYLVAQIYEPGSDKFTDVFETAVRMYPNDETANLNAANAAMRRGDNATAERYLAKAGDTPEAVYARGALAIRKGDLDTARRYLLKAKELGVRQAESTLEAIK